MWSKLQKAGSNPVQCLADTWHFLTRDGRARVEVALTGAAGGPSRNGKWCHCSVATFADFCARISEAEAWEPDGLYVRLNPSSHTAAFRWCEMLKGGVVEAAQIDRISVVFIDADPVNDGQPYSEPFARACVAAIVTMYELLCITLGQPLRAAFVFSGRGAALWIQSDLPNSRETSIKLQALLIQLRAVLGHVQMVKLDSTSLTPSQLSALPGIWKRKTSAQPKAARKHIPYARTAMTIEGSVTLSEEMLDQLCERLSVAVLELPNDDACEEFSGRALRDFVNELIPPRDTLRLLGYDIEAPDCPCCTWLRANGRIHKSKGGRGGGAGGVKWLTDGRLWCHHDSCLTHKNGRRPMAAFDLAALHMFGSDQLTLDQLRTVETWFVVHTNIIQTIKALSPKLPEETL